MSHTPGPLTARLLIEEDGDLLSANIMKGERRIGSATVRPDLPSEGNAYLWAASPDLLEALVDLVGVLDAAGLVNLSSGVQLGPAAWYRETADSLDYARDAIAKATEGGSE